MPCPSFEPESPSKSTTYLTSRRCGDVTHNSRLKKVWISPQSHARYRLQSEQRSGLAVVVTGNIAQSPSAIIEKGDAHTLGLPAESSKPYCSPLPLMVPDRMNSRELSVTRSEFVYRRPTPDEHVRVIHNSRRGGQGILTNYVEEHAGISQTSLGVPIMAKGPRTRVVFRGKRAPVSVGVR